MQKKYYLCSVNYKILSFMKKLLLSLAVVFGIATAANAQLVIGGSLWLNGNTGNVRWDSNDGRQNHGDSWFAFGFAPKVGYIIKDKFEVGGALGFNYRHTTTYVTLFDAENKNGKSFKDYREANFMWNFTPYFRYRLVEGKGFGLWLEADMNFGAGFWGDKRWFAYSYEGQERTQQDCDDLRKDFLDAGRLPILFNWQVGLQPVVTYTIKEHFRLELTLDVLRAYLNADAEFNYYENGGDTGNKSGVTTTSSFRAGFGLMDKLFNGNVNADATNPWFRLGFAYKF